jgi:uncharacterized membrane protein
VRIRFQLAFDALRYSFTFTPVVLALLGLALAFASLELDHQAARFPVSRSILLYTGGVDSARSVLSTVAASVLSVAALAFSICITALALAAGQFGSRLLRNFLDDGAFKWTLGIFSATFLFCLVVLRSTRGAEDGGVFVPQLSISIALLLTITCVLLLCFFLNHVARSIQAPYVCADAAKDLHREIERLFAVVQRQRGHKAQKPILAPSFSSATPIFGTRDGYVKVLNYDFLIDLARRENLVFEMKTRPGEFAFRGEPILRVLSTQNAPISSENTVQLEENVRHAVVLGRSRSALQDPEYGINQLVEIAVRALSPAINDPFTAGTCLDHLGAALRHVLRLELPSPLLCDETGKLRVVAKAWTFSGLCDAAFNMIRQYGRDSASVSIHLLETLEKVAHACDSEEERAIIAHHAKMTRRECQAEIEGISDKNDVEERFARVMAALEEGKT